MSGPCLREALSALVDGELEHGARERAHAHLAGCADCRAELEAERAVKNRLTGLRAAASTPPAGLVEALTALAVPGVEPTCLPPATGHPVRLRRPGMAQRPGDRRPASPRAPRRRVPRSAAPRDGDGRPSRWRRTGALSGGLLVLGVMAALALGGSSGTPASTPVDPGTDAFVVDFVSTSTSAVPLGDPAGGAASSPRR